MGALGYAGIPLTHRDTNQVVSFLTGHDAQGVVPSAVDWNALAKSSPVIVMYMALKHHETIVSKLIEAGRRSDEAVAIIRDATLPTQEVVETTLAGMPTIIAERDIQPPAIIVVGAVVHFRKALDWIGMMSGKRPEADPLKNRRQRDVG